MTAEDIDRWLAVKAKLLSTRTLRLLRSVLNRAVTRAMARNKVKHNVVGLCEIPEGRAGRKSKSLTLDQAKALLAAAENSRLRAYITVSLLTGARTEELRALTWDHVDLTGDPDAEPPVPPSIGVWHSVRDGGDTKTVKSRRTLALPIRCVRAFGYQREQQTRDRATAGKKWHHTDLVFASKTGLDLDAANVRRAFRRVVELAGLSPREWTPRELRHSFVSLLSSNGVTTQDIADLCGHSGTIVTERVYRHELRPVLLNGAVAMDAIFGLRAGGGPRGVPPHPAFRRRVAGSSSGCWLVLPVVIDDERFDEDGIDRTVDHAAKERRALETALKVLAQVAGAGVGLAIGGPAGAMMGAGVVPVLEMWAVGRRRAVAGLSDVVLDETGMSPEQFVAWVHASEAREELVVAAISAALTSATRRKLVALGRVVAEGVRDDTKLDVALLVVQAVSDFSEAHVIVLDAVAKAEFAGETRWGPIAEGGFLQAQLEERFPTLAPGILAITAGLERHGLVSEGLAADHGNRAWTITPFGYECLAYLRSNPVQPDSETSAGEP